MIVYVLVPVGSLIPVGIYTNKKKARKGAKESIWKPVYVQICDTETQLIGMPITVERALS